MFREVPTERDELLDVVSGDGDWIVAVLRGYFDAGKRESGVFTVAGYLFDAAQARKFRREWNEVFGKFKGGLHTTDFFALGGEYKKAGLSRDDRDEMVKQAIAIIRNRMICGVAVSCWVQDVENHSPKWIKGFKSPYSICSHLAMSSMAIWAVKNKCEKSGIAYTFEAGDRYANEANYMMSNAATHPEVQYGYQYRSHHFLPKGELEAVPIQAADFLAWEWSKYFDETFHLEKRPMRKSLGYLLDGQAHRYMLRPMYGEKFIKFLGNIRDLGVEQLQELKEAGETEHNNFNIDEVLSSVKPNQSE